MSIFHINVGIKGRVAKAIKNIMEKTTQRVDMRMMIVQIKTIM